MIAYNSFETNKRLSAYLLRRDILSLSTGLSVGHCLGINLLNTLLANLDR